MELMPPAGPARRRQLIQLGLVVVLGLGLLWYQYRGGDQTAAPATASNAPGAAARPRTAPALPEPLALSAREPVPDTVTVGRNPFRFAEAPRAELPAAPPVVSAPPPVTPPMPTGPPAIALKLLGVVQLPGGQTVATLRDPASGAVFQGIEGQIVEGRYRIVKLGTQSAVVSYLDGTGQRTIPLGG